jgi:putative membrane protein
MIEYDNKHWFRFLFKGSGYHFDGVFFSLLIYGALVAALTFVHLGFNWTIFHIPASFHTVLGLVIGLLLVFRTNTAYERWWEGRKQLGALLNTVRNLAMKYKAYINHEDDVVYTLLEAFPWTLKENLRSKDYSSVAEHIPADMIAAFNKAYHKPNFILAELSKRTNELMMNKKINGEQFLILENKISELTDILGACERIKNTPIPFGYAIHLKRILLIYLITLPFAFVESIGWWSIPVAMIVFYTMIGIELIAEEIEDPFGNDENDLPVDDIEDKIRLNVEEIKER